MNYRIIGALAAISLLAACAHNAEPTAASANGSGAAATSGGVVPGSEEDLVASAGDRVFFALNKSNLDEDAHTILDKQSSWLGRYQQVSVQVAGNTDDRGTEEYNIALGQRRANAARDYLVAKGVAAARISTISFGKDHPTAQGDDESAYMQNRNATTSVK